MRAAVQFALGSLVGLATLGYAASSAAAVTAGDGSYSFVFNPNQTEIVNITLNITENFDLDKQPLVSGSPRPLQLIDAVTTNSAVQVSRFRNCVTLSFQAPGPDGFELAYTVADGSTAGEFGTASGLITFVGSSLASYVSPKDQNCGDAQFTAVANDDAIKTPANQEILIPVLNNDSSPSAENQPIVFASGERGIDLLQIATTSGGTASVRADFQIRYQPPLGFSGTDTFSYTLKNYAQSGFAALNPRAQVTITVLPDTATPPTPQPEPQPQPEPGPDPTPMPEVEGRILVNGSTATTIADSNLVAGETVSFEAAADDPASLSNIVNFAWFVGKESTARQSGPSPKFSTALPDGQIEIKVVGTDAAGVSGMASITVTVGAAPTMLTELAGLQPNQMGVAAALDRMCRTAPANETPAQSMTVDQLDAMARCQAIARADAADQMRALEELSATDFNSSRTQTLLFTKSTYSGVTDRLGALRGGARGVSLKGMNLIIDGKTVALADLQHMVGKLLGSGASADDAGSLLGDRWGLWTRGNITFGKKAGSASDNGFRADQVSLVTGLDYRLTDASAVGGALSFGASNVSYNPVGEGGLDTESWALALYGTSYLFKRGYVDAVLNLADSSYDTHRHISYTDRFGLLDRNARGKTGGFTWSGGLSSGYDLVFKGLTISPNGSMFYTDSAIESFRERGAGGLDLAYADQRFQSLTATAGLRINYAMTLPFGVLMPYVRSDFVRELQSRVAIFNVRFANDLDSTAAPIAVQSEAPDQSYWRLSSGMSAQLPFGFAGYVEYQRLEGFELVKFQDFAMGLRMQYRF